MKLFLTIIVCICCAASAHADTNSSLITELVPQVTAADSAPPEDPIPNLELQLESTTGKYPARAEAYLQYKNIFGYVDVESDGYAEMYFGGIVAPVPWLQIGLGIGAEHPGGLRKAIWMDAGIGDLHVAAAYEHGHTGPWHEITAVYKFHDRIGVGLMDRTELGLGPRLEYDLAEGFQLWGAILTSHGNTALTIGVKKEI